MNDEAAPVITFPLPREWKDKLGSAATLSREAAEVLYYQLSLALDVIRRTEPGVELSPENKDAALTLLLDAVTVEEIFTAQSQAKQLLGLDVA